MANIKTIGGYVVDLTGAPLVGKTATLKNNATGATITTTTTDANGYWEFANRDETLTYKVEIAVGGSSTQKLVRRPAALELTQLYVTGRAIVGAGAVGAPGLAFASDDDTGLYRSAADTLDLATAGTRRAQFASDGRIGLGTAAGTGVNAFILNNTAATNVGLLVRGIASQSVDIFRVEDSAAARLFAIDQDGHLRADKFVSVATSLGALAGVVTIKYGVGGASTGYIPVYSSFVT